MRWRHTHDTGLPAQDSTAAKHPQVPHTCGSSGRSLLMMDTAAQMPVPHCPTLPDRTTDLQSPACLGDPSPPREPTVIPYPNPYCGQGKPQKTASVTEAPRSQQSGQPRGGCQTVGGVRWAHSLTQPAFRVTVQPHASGRKGAVGPEQPQPWPREGPGAGSPRRPPGTARCAGLRCAGPRHDGREPLWSCWGWGWGAGQAWADLGGLLVCPGDLSSSV